MAVTQAITERTTTSIVMDRADLNAWTRLAREKGYSRSDLINKVLGDVGLDYARSLEPTVTGAGYRTSAEAAA